MIYFDCPDCGNLFESQEHLLGCEPFHNLLDPECRIRPPEMGSNPLAVCATCSPMKKRAA